MWVSGGPAHIKRKIADIILLKCAILWAVGVRTFVTGIRQTYALPQDCRGRGQIPELYLWPQSERDEGVYFVILNYPCERFLFF